MRKTTRYLAIIVFVLVILFLGLALVKQNYFVVLKNKNNVTTTLEKKSETAKEQPAQIKISIKVDKLILQPTVSSGTSLYDALMNEKNSNNLILNGKTSPGLGFFVTKIGDLKSTDKKFIVYYINGESATVGISSYFPKDGDVIEWKYAE
jgi:hypothetical protein